ncbi:MAG: DUF1330 domain-containing protein [Halobacteriales archaeon]|nr:DUF1330 domain-containing protein [Halobacteriales archaeon]
MSRDTEESRKGYALFQLELTDRDRYLNEYVPPTVETIEAHGGRVLVSTDAPQVLEGEWTFDRTVLIEFPSVEDARAWYTDETYEEVSQIRHDITGVENAVIVPGLAPE